MNEQQRKAMKLALEALEYIHEGANNQGPHTGISWRCVSNKAEPAITALREALAEPTSADYAMGYAEGFNDACKPAQQEPVAWMRQDGQRVITANDRSRYFYYKPRYSIPLYTSPPAQRTWVNATTWRGLTDKEAMQICVDCGCLSEDWLTLLDAIESKLKEKNCDRKQRSRT